MVVDRLDLDEAEIDRLFHALADRTRRDILTTSMTGDHSVSALARRYPISFAAIQKHVAVLEEAGLVTKAKHGREQRVTTNMAAIEQARLLLDHFERIWRARLDRFESVLSESIFTESVGTESAAQAKKKPSRNETTACP